MRLLLVEDKDSFRRLLVQALNGSTWDVLAVGDPQEALEALERSPFELLVTDLRLPGMSGLELLKRAKRAHSGIRILLMSAFGEPKDIVEAMRSGADDFLPKPFDLDQFLSVLNRMAALVEAPPPDPREPWVAHSPAMRALERQLSKAAEASASVLFVGDRGVGKQRAARRLHSLRNPQAPFLSLSAVTGLPSERTLRLLQGGSLYLKDLEDLTESQLASLTQVLESETGRSIRWMAGIRGDARTSEMIRLRFGVLTFEIPPLRDHKEDVLPLFRTFLERACRQEGRPYPILERNLERELLQREWPGHVQELLWCVSQALRATQGTVLAPLPSSGTDAVSALCLPWPHPATLEAMLNQLSKAAEPMLLSRALRDHRRDLSATAAALGLTPRTFAQRLKEHRIPLDD